MTPNVTSLMTGICSVLSNMHLNTGLDAGQDITSIWTVANRNSSINITTINIFNNTFIAGTTRRQKYVPLIKVIE